VPIIQHHHERWDGRGYPDGLAETEIPLAAAVVGLADASSQKRRSRLPPPSSGWPTPGMP